MERTPVSLKTKLTLRPVVRQRKRTTRVSWIQTCALERGTAVSSRDRVKFPVEIWVAARAARNRNYVSDAAGRRVVGKSR